jgi:hypothetical protein
VDERQNLHLGRRHLVDQAISLNKELPDVGLVEFRNDAAALAEDVRRSAARWESWAT